ncbi:MAG: sugar transferase [Peptococcia bacterium]|jgi:undecaprenyl phosphate N,N'-diacetylbacillosamine 1-phosphate transferase
MKKYFYIKCILDFIFALSAILVIWPILLIIAILIKLESKGPVFFLQERLGRNGSVFKIYKFRTMVDGAINLGSGLRTYEGDPRITKVGSFLRKTSLDELPQIFNILRGEMSFIGPRPPVPYYPRKYEDYSIEQKRRFMVRPGISGYAQVVLRNSGTWDERIKLDLEYVDRMSFLFDMSIFLKSIFVVLMRRNIYPTSNVRDFSKKL